MTLLPREHGAYGQMAFPLVTSLAVAGLSVPAVLLTLGVVAAFLAHEPLLVTLGRRGPRAKREEGRRASAWLAATAGTAAIAGGLGAVLMPVSALWSFALPAAPALVLAIAVARNREKSAVGEIAVALAFSLAAVPICLAAGASVGVALAVAVSFGVMFVLSTLAVRAVIVSVRAGGNPRAARRMRGAVLAMAFASAWALAAAALRGGLPWTGLVASAPGLVAAAWLSLAPPHPSRLRVVGWTLVATSFATALILIIGLR